MRGFIFGGFTWMLGLSLGLNGALADSPADPNYCRPGKACAYFEAAEFSGWDTLGETETRLLTDFLKPEESNASDLFSHWLEGNNSEAAAFLAVMLSLKHLVLTIGESEAFEATALVEKINRLAGDRVYVKLNAELFERWRQAGAQFTLYREDGEVETGRMKFRNYSWFGGSLHRGYDIAGYTSARKAPRIQFNYRFSDSEADIDIDGIAPIIGKFIPNLKHLTYANSDVRQWFSAFEQKFGNPGFKVRLRQVEGRN